MDYLGIMDDLFKMAQKAAVMANSLLLTDTKKSIQINIFYRECFEFYKDIEELGVTL